MPAAWESAVVDSNGVEKSFSDDREYRHVVLDNGLRVLLASDPKTDKAGAAMDVHVGHFSDPEEIPGLAHFLEHMLFLGTAKYPDENSYSAFLSEQGGRSNAYTSTENTNYYFDVGHGSLRGALDRFAQFFIAPLFTATATDRELNAVDSEHSKNLQDDHWRMYQLEKSTSNPLHPYHKFATGDSATLRDTPSANGIDVRAQLIAFHAQWYVAPRMCLVLLGREPLSKLEEWARECFSDVSARDGRKEGPCYDARGAEPLPAALLPRLLEVVPVKDLRTIELTWAAPSMLPHRDSGPERYLSHLLGHEGPGSVLAALKNLGWANELSAGLSANCADFSLFKVSVDCTAAGIAKVDHIVAMVFAYLGEVARAGPQEWVWEEEAAQGANAFRFQSPQQAFSFVSAVSARMRTHSPQHSLSGGLLRRFDATAVRDLLSLLTPQRLQLCVAHQAVSATQEEKWYKTRFQLRSVDGPRAQLWAAPDALQRLLTAEERSASVLALPPRNAFLPSDFVLRTFKAPRQALRPDDVMTRLGATAGMSAALRVALEEAHGGVFALSDHAHHGPHHGPHGPHEGNEDDSESEGDPEAVHAARRRQWRVEERSALQQWSDDEDLWRPPVALAAGDQVGGLLWFKQDCALGLPKGAVTLFLRSPHAYESPLAAVLTELLALLVQDALVDFAYAAEVAGLNYQLRNSTAGITVTVGGFSHKLGLLLARVMETLCAPDAAVSEAALERFREKLAQDYRNFDKEQAYQHAMYACTLLLNTPRWSVDEKLRAMQQIHAEPAAARNQLLAHARAFFGSASLETLVVGNFAPEEALALAREARSFLPHPMPAAAEVLTSPASRARVVALPARTHAYWLAAGKDPENVNSAVEVVLQVGQEAAAPALRALLAVLAQVAQEPCFNTLRTEQQLGYIVFCGVREDLGVCALRFIVQSSRADPFVVDARVEQFLKTLETLLADMSEHALAQHVDAVLDALLERDKTVFAQLTRFGGEIEHQSYRFARAAQLSAEVAAVRKQDLLEFFRAHMSISGELRRKLVGGIFGASHADALRATPARAEGDGARREHAAAQIAQQLATREAPAPHIISSLEDFRRSSALFPALFAPKL